MLTKRRLTEIAVPIGVLVIAGLAWNRATSTGVFALIVAVAIGLTVGFSSLLASKRKRQQFHSRSPFAAEELFESYYAGSGLDKEVFVRLWRQCASALGIPPEKLRPADRFEHELAASDFWASLDDPRETLARFATAHAKNSGVTIDLKQTKTVDELVRKLVMIETSSGAR